MFSSSLPTVTTAIPSWFMLDMEINSLVYATRPKDSRCFMVCPAMAKYIFIYSVYSPSPGDSQKV